MVTRKFLNLFSKKVLILIRKSISKLVPKRLTVNFYQNCRLSLKFLHYCTYYHHGNENESNIKHFDKPFSSIHFFQKLMPKMTIYCQIIFHHK